MLFRSAAALALSLISPAAAQWPDRTVTIVVPYAAGGNTDTMARMAADWLNQRLGQRFVVENRVGAAATLGAAFVANAKPDGTTFLFGASPQILVAPFLQKVNYDSSKSFDFVGIFGTGPNILALHRDVPAKTVPELIAYGKANPGKISYASGGHGSHGHLTGGLFASRAGIDIVHVPYKGGPPAATDLMAGEIELLFFNTPAALPYIKSGRLRALGVSTAKRSPLLPDVPSIGDTVKGFDTDVWFGLVAPAGTPADIIAKTQRDIATVVALPDVRKQLLDLGAEPVVNTPDVFAARIKKESALWAKVVQNARIKIGRAHV